jgi:hypothetical protein
MVKKCLFCLLVMLPAAFLQGQTLGGSSVYNFLKIPPHPHVGALGGRNISNFSGELALALENPSLLRASNHGNVSSNFTFLAPTLTMLNANGAFHIPKIATTFAIAANHLQYGNIDQTDASGNTLGIFNPFDQVVQLTASRSYNVKWHYGISLKYINSRYGAYKSSAVASDVGLTYYDEERLFQAGFSARNMGTQISTYAGTGEDLPFDLSLGITKQLEKAPIRFSLTAQRIHQFDIIYNDSIFNTDNFGINPKNEFVNKLLSHFVAATDILLGDNFVFTAGYNFLRRKELIVPNLSNGLTGVSYGLKVKLNRLDFYFSRSHYQSNTALTQVGISYKLIEVD